MPIKGVTPKCYILSLFVRDDGERFVLGSGYYEFKDKQMHFKANNVANDVIEVQGNDGYLLAGQVRRPGAQEFDGFVGDGTVSKAEVEQKRRAFLAFFRKNHFYKVVYVFSDGTAIQRKRGFLVDDPTVKELYQIYPEYHVALNFEDVNYYSYAEDEDGEEIYSKIAEIQLTQSVATGGLVWDEYGVVWDERQWGGTPASAGGSTSFVVNNQAGKGAPLASVQLNGDTSQQTYSGKNLFNSTIEIGGLDINGETWNRTNRLDSRDYIEVQPNTTYVFSAKPKISGKTINAYFYAYNGTTPISQIPANAWYPLPLAITTPANCNRLRFCARYSDDTVFGTVGDVSDALQDAQLELGSTATAYEPYVGSTATQITPSPNPDYPQDIQVVTGAQTAKVTGKNLMPMVDGAVTDQGITLTIDKGILTVNGTSSGITYFKLTNGIISNSGSTIPTTWLSESVTNWNGKTLSMKFLSGTAPSAGSAFRFFTNTTSHIWQSYPNISRENTFSTDEDISCFALFVNPGITFNNAKYEIQLEEGPSATSYEPYQSQDYTVNLTSKNIFNTTIVIGGWSASGLPIGNSARFNSQDKIAVLPQTTYTFSGIPKDSSKTLNITIQTYDSEDAIISQLPSPSYFANVPFTFTTPANCTKITFSGRYSDNTNFGTIGQVTDAIQDVQIELGSTATSYASYFTPIELAKIGTYQDYIYKSGDDWYVHKEIGKKTITSTTGTYYGIYNTADTTVLFGILGTGTSRSGADGISDYFGRSTSAIYSNRTMTGMWVTVGGNPLYFRVFKTTAETTTEFKAWLDDKQPLLYYALPDFTDTKITDATLIGELEAVEATKLYAGENNFLVTASGTNLPAPLDITYYAEVIYPGGAEWSEGAPMGPTTVEVDSIDTVFPVWTVTGPAINPQLSVLTTNTTFKYNGTVSSSQTLVVDMMNKTVLLNGVNMIGNMEGDWASFSPGTNRVVYTTENTDAVASVIEWQEIVG